MLFSRFVTQKRDILALKKQFMTYSEVPLLTQDRRLNLGLNRISRLKDKARGHKGERGVLTCTVKSPLADNAVYSGESAVSNSAIAELGTFLHSAEGRQNMGLRHFTFKRFSLNLR